MHALIMMNIDGFAAVNETYGNEAGDKILTELAQKLTIFFRQYDLVGHCGGDEFCVFMTSVPSAQLVAEKCAALERLLEDESFKESPAEISITIGAALSVGRAKSFAVLYQNADQALYAAKKRGKNHAAPLEHQGAFPA